MYPSQSVFSGGQVATHEWLAYNTPRTRLDDVGDGRAPASAFRTGMSIGPAVVGRVRGRDMPPRSGWRVFLAGMTERHHGTHGTHGTQGNKLPSPATGPADWAEISGDLGRRRAVGTASARYLCREVGVGHPTTTPCSGHSSARRSAARAPRPGRRRRGRSPHRRARRRAPAGARSRASRALSSL